MNYDDIIDGIAGFFKQLNQIILIRFKRSVIVQKNINSSICGFGNRKSRCGQIGINQNDYWFHSINQSIQILRVNNAKFTRDDFRVIFSVYKLYTLHVKIC